jgi:hypothetical protein
MDCKIYTKIHKDINYLIYVSSNPFLKNGLLFKTNIYIKLKETIINNIYVTLYKQFVGIVKPKIIFNKDYFKNYYMQNREKILEKRKKYHIENKEKSKEYYKNNKKYYNEHYQKYYAANPEYFREYSKYYYGINKDKIK